MVLIYRISTFYEITVNKVIYKSQLRPFSIILHALQKCCRTETGRGRLSYADVDYNNCNS